MRVRVRVRVSVRVRVRGSGSGSGFEFGVRVRVRVRVRGGVFTKSNELCLPDLLLFHKLGRQIDNLLPVPCARYHRPTSVGGQA